MLYILQNRLKHYLLPQIPLEQSGFVPGRETRDQLINIKQMIEKFYEYNVPSIFCFLDYSKAFDHVRWDMMWRVLQEMTVPNHLIYLIESLYNNNAAFIRIDGDLSSGLMSERVFVRAVCSHFFSSMLIGNGS